MPESDIDRILAAIDKLDGRVGDMHTNLAVFEERLRQHDAKIQEHAFAIDALQKTRALTADVEALKARVKTLEDDALAERVRRKTWGVILAIGGGIVGAVVKALLPKLF